jgi:tyrosyl-tRNA synthetase
MFTFLPLEEIDELESLTGSDINVAKEKLAFEATKITHGEAEARKALQTAHVRFGAPALSTKAGPAAQGRVVDDGPSLAAPGQLVDEGPSMAAQGRVVDEGPSLAAQGRVVDEGPSVVVRQPTSIVDLLVPALAESRNAAKHLIRGGGVRLGDTKVEFADRVVDPSELPVLLSVGKRKVRLVAG